MSLFYPTLLKPHITAITPDDLRSLGVKGLLLDVDNTLTTHGSQVLDPAIKAWLERMAEEGFALTIVSNALPRRVRPFAQRIGLRFSAFSCKPSPFGFWRAARRLGLPRKQCVAIGDQTFTDIIGANLCGIPSIQLLPIQLETGKPTLTVKRWLEKKILARYHRKNGYTSDGSNA